MEDYSHLPEDCLFDLAQWGNPEQRAAAVTVLLGRYPCGLAQLSEERLLVLIWCGIPAAREAALPIFLGRSRVDLAGVPDGGLLILIQFGTPEQRDDALRVFLVWLLVGVRQQFPNLPNDAEDVTQEAIIVFHSRIASLEPYGCRAWLWLVAYRIALDCWRRSSRRRTASGTDVPVGDPPSPHLAPEVEVDLGDLQEHVLRRLPSGLRDIWIASVLERKTQDTIARARGTSISTINRKLAEARTLVEQILVEHL